MPTAPPTPAAVRGTAAWRNAVFCIFALSGMGFATWVSRLPAVRDGMGLSTGTIGLLLFGLSAGSILGLAVAPAYLARWGARRGMKHTLMAMAVSTAGLGATAGMLDSPLLTAAMLVLFGLTYSITDVLMNVEGADVEKAAGRTLLPMMHAFFSLGTIAGAVLGAGAAGLRLPVEAHFALMAVAMAVASRVAVRYLRTREEAPVGTGGPGGRSPVRPASTADRLRGVLLLAREPQLILLGLMVVGMAFAEGSANDWLTLAAVDGHGFGNATGALVYGSFVTAMTIGRAAGGPLIDRFGRLRTMTAMASVGVLGIVVFIVTDVPWIAFAAAALWGLGGSLGFPVGISAAADHPTHAARRVSMVSIFGYMAFLVGPPLLGLFGEIWGILSAFYFVAGMVLASLAVMPKALATRTAGSARPVAPPGGRPVA